MTWFANNMQNLQKFLSFNFQTESQQNAGPNFQAYNR